jgi:hypothetical protein
MNKYTENFTDISVEIYDKIAKATVKLKCVPILICRASNHPEDDYLYVVIGQYIEPHPIYGKAYCVWTANTSRPSESADLHYGSYGVSFKNALKIAEDKIRDLNKEEC